MTESSDFCEACSFEVQVSAAFKRRLLPQPNGAMASSWVGLPGACDEFAEGLTPAVASELIALRSRYAVRER